MSESERIQAMKAVQMELFQIATEFRAKQKELKRRLKELANNGTKQCGRCGFRMDVEQFSRDASRADGRDYYCLECRGELGRLRRRVAA